MTRAFQLMADGELIEYVCNENNLAPPHLVASNPPPHKQALSAGGAMHSACGRLPR